MPGLPRRYAAVLALFGAVTVALVALRPFLGLAAVALVYLVIVFLSAVWWGRGPSLLASVLAFSAVNFFFTVPYNTFIVASTQDVITLGVFLLVAVMTSRMVTERLRLQEEAAQTEILRRADDLKSQLLSAVSHDLRTPLASIRVAATALHQNGARWAEGTREDLLEMIDAEASRLSRLVGNLLDLSRIEAGALHPEKEWRDLNEVVGRAIDVLQNRLRGRELEVVMPENLPLIPLDFTQIEGVLVNLLDNAARHSPEGSKIRVVARSEQTRVIVQVENEGPSIPVDEAEAIFHRFHSGKGDAPGRSGLGLAICKGLVEAHAGRIWVERPGEPGARVAFSLPLEGGAGFAGERPPAARP